jgi:hypothetical protein
MNVGYLISTNVNYLVPLNRLLDSMLANGVAPERIKIASGGNVLRGIPKMEDFGGCDLIEVEHNSFDYTALIELMMVPAFCQFSHYFLLQDTMEFGPRTDELIKKECEEFPEVDSIAAFGGQCNLALYSFNYLHALKSYILSLRNLTKLMAVQLEGSLWRMAKTKRSFPNSACDVVGRGNPYGGAERIKEYYAGVDVVKWKANWGQNMDKMEVRP